MTNTIEKPVSKPSKKKFLNSINYFRGIAIIMIVLGHCYDLAQWDISSTWEKLVYSTTVNGSIYFVFISGFLYYHIFYHRFNYQKFMVKKLQFVLVPYLLFSLIPVLYEVFVNQGYQDIPNVLGQEPFVAVAWYLSIGKVNYAYWYIPMAMLLFAISPGINWIIRTKKVYLFSLFLLPISLVIHRPINNENPIHSLIYFLPVYFLGIWSSIHQERIFAYLQSYRKKIALIAIAIALGTMQVLVFQEAGNFHKEFWSITVPDVNLLQKLVLCFFFLAFLDIYEDTDISVIKKTAETSFAIYFIHPFLINGLYSIFSRLNFDYEGNFLTLILSTCLIVICSIAIASTVKKVLQKNSRYLIGW